MTGDGRLMTGVEPGPAPTRRTSRIVRRMLWVIAGALACTTAADDDLYELRNQYKNAVHALQVGRVGEFRRALRDLEGYALHPYLVYYDVESRLRHLSPADAVEARNTLAAMPLGERLYGRWLVAQAQRGRWQVYRDHYVPQQRADARCYHARALYRTGDREAALALAPDLWVVGESQPKACDPLFEVWMAAGGRTEEMAWRRLGLAIENNERTLARYLLRFFTGSRAKAAQAYYDGHVRPQVAGQPARFPDTEHGHEALAHALTRYAARSPADAAKAWQRYRGRASMTAGIRTYVDERIALGLAKLGEFPADPNPAADSHSPDYRTGMAAANVAHLRWTEATGWIDTFDTATRDTLEWRYWLGRGLTAAGDDTARGEAVLRDLATHRHYYGFLAADRLGIAPSLNERGGRVDASVRGNLRRNPAVERMTELFAVGDRVNARREWFAIYDELSLEDRHGLVELVSDMGWIEQGIIGASQAELTDHLAVRFPTPFLDTYQRHAFATNLPVSFLFAVSRQESAFNPRALSPAGARGLMQLMGVTARATAANVRLRRPSAADLFDPDTNVTLGAHHLAELMARYDNHRALVAAAYNAGTGRVNRWLRERGDMPTDVWIETIPFAETRGYVKSVLAFSYVYASRLGRSVPVLGAHERRVP